MIPHRSSCHLHRRGRCFSSAFTLVELLTVVLIILVLSGVVIGMVGYVKRQVAVNQAKCELAAMVLALDRYKDDHGHYPTTTLVRCSSSWSAEATNSAILYAAIKGRYMSFRPSQLRPPSGGNQYIVDPWGQPYNYFCTRPALSSLFVDNVSYCTTGGQVNAMTFDLFSYGPDFVTYVPGAAWTNLLIKFQWSNPTNASDDITSSK